MREIGSPTPILKSEDLRDRKKEGKHWVNRLEHHYIMSDDRVWIGCSPSNHLCHLDLKKIWKRAQYVWRLSLIEYFSLCELKYWVWGKAVGKKWVVIKMKETLSAVVLIYWGKQNNFVEYEKTQLDAYEWWKYFKARLAVLWLVQWVLTFLCVCVCVRTSWSMTTTAPCVRKRVSCSNATPAHAPTTPTASIRHSKRHPRVYGCAPSARRRYTVTAKVNRPGTARTGTARPKMRTANKLWQFAS